MRDLLGDLLQSERVIYGVLCRDTTLTDLELMHLAGYRIVWFDLEHGAMSLADVLTHVRTAEHLGMASLVRVPQVLKAYIQPLVDQGVRVIVLPDVRGAADAKELVRVARFPPLGHRGGAAATAWSEYATGDQIAGLMRTADEGLHLMVQIESDEALAALDEILAVPGIDMVTVGPLDWRLHAPGSVDPDISQKVEQVISRASRLGKTAAMLVSGPEEAARYVAVGLRMVFVGADIGMRRRIYQQTLERYRAEVRS